MLFEKRFLVVPVLILVLLSIFSFTAFGADFNHEELYLCSSVNDIEKQLMDQYNEALDEYEENEDKNIDSDSNDSDNNLTVIEEQDSDDISEKFSGDANEVIDDNTQTENAKSDKEPNVLLIVFISLYILLTAGCTVYVLVKINGSKMSKLWVLLPIFASIIGLIVFIVVRSKRK